MVKLWNFLGNIQLATNNFDAGEALLRSGIGGRQEFVKTDKISREIGRFLDNIIN